MTKRLVENCDYFLHFVRFANKANPALAVENSDGTVDIYLNTLYDIFSLRSAFPHEIIHIAEDHFYLDLPINTIERQADQPTIIIPVYGACVDTNLVVHL